MYFVRWKPSIGSAGGRILPTRRLEGCQVAEVVYFSALLWMSLSTAAGHWAEGQEVVVLGEVGAIKLV